MKPFIIPILIEKEGVKYKYIYLNFSQHGSIYVLFPRKKGYLVKSQKDIPLPMKGEHNLTLDSIEKTFKSPYITFHPRNKSIHINDREGLIFQYDVPTLNMAEEGQHVFPLAQIILSPSNAFLDIYAKEKYTTPLIFGLSKVDPKSVLSLEIWIHPVGTYIDPEDLPLRNVRQRSANLLGLFKLENPGLRHYTCTVVAEELKGEGDNERIIIFIQNDARPYIFDVIPNN